MGLATAFELATRGASVKVFERDDRVGGMSASIDFSGTKIERYYHFVCKTDLDLFEYLKTFDLYDRLTWVETKMSMYHGGELHEWGTPWGLLKFPGMNLVDKIRYALHVMRTKSIKDWRPYDAISATEWLRRWIGQGAYDALWKNLFHYKFYEFQDEISAAWIGTRIKRVALSRKNIFREEMGYIQGGTEILLEAIVAQIEALGGTIALATPVDEVVVREGRVQGVRSGDTFEAFDQVISTIPLPYVPRLVPELSQKSREQIVAISNVGVVCVLLKLRHRFSDAFWLNICHPQVEIPGVIEYTNLNPIAGEEGPAIIYAPFYMPQTNPKYSRSKQAFIEETLTALETIRPDFDRSQVIAAEASRYEYSQTVCRVGFYQDMVPTKNEIGGFFLADTSHCYPEDRSVSESIRIAKVLAEQAWSS